MPLGTIANGEVINDLTEGITTTCISARIDAFVGEACFVDGTIGVGDTIGSASNERVTDETFDAGARESSTALSALGVRATNGIATTYRLIDENIGGRAVLVRVSMKSRRAPTLRLVVDDTTDGIDATRSNARIRTALANASLVEGTVTVDDAFGSTSRVIFCVWQAARVANGHASVLDTSVLLAARMPLAGWVTCVRYNGHQHALVEGVSNVSDLASTMGDVVKDFA